MQKILNALEKLQKQVNNLIALVEQENNFYNSAPPIHVTVRDGKTAQVGRPIEFVYYRQAMKKPTDQENWVEGTLLYPPTTNHQGRLTYPVIKKGGAVLHHVLANDMRVKEKPND